MQKKITIQGAILTLAAALVLALTLSSALAAPGGKGKGKPPKDDAAPMTATFLDAGSDGINSDGMGLYEDGKAEVSMVIGKFRFGLNVGMDEPMRNFILNLDTTQCMGVGCGRVPNLTAGRTVGWNVFSTSPDGAQFLEMFETESKTNLDFQLDFFDDSGEHWRVEFRPDASECAGSNSVTVTKINDNPDTWEFVATDDDFACLLLRSSHPRSFHGLYPMPFTLTVVKP